MDYDTFRKILEAIAGMGKGTVMFFVDVKSAYKLLNINPQEWFLQVFRIGKEFFVGLTGMFGDVAAGDNWDRFMRVLLAILRRLFPEVIWFCYVDNIVGLIPPLNGRIPNWFLAVSTFKKFISLTKDIGLPIHDEIEPTLKVENCLGWGIDTDKELVFIKPERMLHICTHLKTYAEGKVSERMFVTQSVFDSLVGIISFCSQILLCLKGPLRFFIETQTEYRKKSQKASVGLGKREIFACKWILYYFGQWEGVIPICRTVWLGTHLRIVTDAGTTPVFPNGVMRGMGAHCIETGGYFSEAWNPEIVDQSRTIKTRHISVPFLETFTVLTAVLTFGRDNMNIHVQTDNTSAAQICSSRWCNTNDILNKYIAFYEFQCAKRGILVQVEQKDRIFNLGAHHLAAGNVGEAARYAQLTTPYLAARLHQLF